MVQATICGTNMWVMFAMLCDQRYRMEERGINPEAPSGMSTVLGSSTRGQNLESTAMDTPNTPGLRLRGHQV